MAVESRVGPGQKREQGQERKRAQAQGQEEGQEHERNLLER